MTTTQAIPTQYSRVGITGAGLDRRTMGRMSRAEWVAATTEHAARINAELPEGLMVNRLGEMFQAEWSEIGFHDFADMILTASRNNR